MKINGKVLIASVVLIAAIVWAISSLQSHSFSGKNLTFGLTSGTATVNNPSDAPIPVQLLGTGSRTFTVSSSSDGIAGSSTRQSAGNGVTQLFEFALPPGKSDITVGHGTNVNFVSTSETKLDATVQPLSAAESNTTIVMAVIVVLGALFFISRTTGHAWINLLRRQQAPVVPLEVVPVVAAAGDTNRGRDGRMYSNYGGKD